ncbi:MAG TPA: hypothetical protein VM030_01060 [Acidimicrobiales bacterium]|nr:hypothetical protein [Acidimicrobiales bacterium]
MERVLRIVIGVLLLASVAVARQAGGQEDVTRAASVGRLRTVAPEPSTTVTEPETTTTTAVAETTVPPTSVAVAATPPPTARVARAPRTARPAPVVAVAPSVAAGLVPYTGLGTWVDVYDWSQTYTRDGAPAVDAATVDAMADAGVQTLYLQASKHDAPTDVLEPERLLPIIDRAHRRGVRVVAWYLPTLVDTAHDLRRILAIASLEIDGLAVDIEARNVSDVNERNRRLVEFSTSLRNALPEQAIGAIVLPPVVLEEVNPNYWPDFPYTALAPLYDAWQTMGYWTNRKASSGWRNAHDYTVENVVRLRRNLGRPDAVVHPIGGIGDATTAADIDGFRRAVGETHGVGGSLYDWRTTKADAWPALRGLRA